MDVLSLSSTAHCSPSPIIAATKHNHRTTTTITPLIRSVKSSDSNNTTTGTTSYSPFSDILRRPVTHKPLKTPPTTKPPTPKPKTSKNPLKNLVSSENTPSISHPSLTNKLWLTSKLNPPPPPPSPPPLKETIFEDNGVMVPDNDSGSVSELPRVEFRQEGKIFVGNLPLWIKKNELSEFFRQFGPIKNVILIKGHDEIERNIGFGFIIYGGPMAAKSAVKAVEFDGVEFHGKVLTVKLDNGRRMKTRSQKRERWVGGEDGEDYPSEWHKERDSLRGELRRVIETRPENWQAVVRAFERIKKPSRKEFGLMVNYYARRGDMHRAREAFESMRARGIEPNSHVYTNLIHAYAVGRDMEEALSCVRKMKDEGVELTLVTYSILVGGFAKVGNADAADQWFKEAKERHASLNSVIYGNIIYAHSQTCNMERAESLVREMEEEGIDAPIDIYHTMIDGYTNIGKEDKCLVVFERLKECGFTPSVISFGCLINLYTKSVYDAFYSLRGDT